MNIIAFDTASDVFSIGLSIEGHKYSISVDSGQKHSELIMDAADTLLRLADIEKSSLNAVACMEGPGSFTGLRIGFSAAKGLALALDIPIIPVPTLDCMAYPLSFWPGMVLPVMDAKKNAFFTALYSQGSRISDYFDIESKQLINTIEATWSGYNQQPRPKGSGYVGSDRYGLYAGLTPLKQNLEFSQTAQRGGVLNPLANKNTSVPLLLVTGPAASMVQNALVEAFPGTVSCGIFHQGYVEGLLNLAIQNSIINKELLDFSVGPLYLRKSDAELTENMDIGNV
ncbi:MAG: tRNA (adenosine(37)-N6)-threonylcarbamoyltransferase complex dimerization subunit type 1 TsaB [Treponema sp.]|nr:tRNA (adenosine(37)-N6)-threonylcarbamoyltransferase complex dimerization subunit type 1 TsaB [Treponema sp.]